MRPRRGPWTCACVLAGLLAAPAALAGEEPVRLKEGPGRDLTVGHCSACHSLDYIQMNSPFLDRKGWEASVNKMIKVMRAQIGAEDAARIAQYLSEQYGRP